MNLHVSRATIHDEAMRETCQGYNPIIKNIALDTSLQLQADPAEFDVVYAALCDEDFRNTFDWFISHCTTLAFLGRDTVEAYRQIAERVHGPSESERVQDT